LGPSAEIVSARSPCSGNGCEGDREWFEEVRLRGSEAMVTSTPWFQGTSRVAVVG